MIFIYQCDFKSVEEFALFYSRIKSQARFLQMLEVNPITKRVSIKDEFKINMNDVTKMQLFFNLIKDAYSIDDAMYIINDIPGTFEKQYRYNKALEQLELYQLALKYGQSTVNRINSLINLYMVL